MPTTRAFAASFARRVAPFHGNSIADVTVEFTVVLQERTCRVDASEPFRQDEIFAVRADAAGTPRDRTAIDWNADGNSNESSVSIDINSDTETDRLNDHNDWSRVKLDF